MKTWKVEAAIIAVGMVLLGVIIKWGINDFIDKERIVSVKGLAEMEVPADKVIWPLMYKDIGMIRRCFMPIWNRKTRQL